MSLETVKEGILLILECRRNNASPRTTLNNVVNILKPVVSETDIALVMEAVVSLSKKSEIEVRANALGDGLTLELKVDK
jgi:hypothetical protein